MGRKRANGDGSVTFDTNAGVWVARLTIGHDQDGKVIRKKFTGKTQKAASDRLKAAVRTLDDGLDLPDERTTTGAWLDHWLDSIEGSVTRGTEATYRSAVRLWVQPSVGTVRLSDLRAPHVAMMMKSMAARGLSGESQRMARAVLRRSLRSAQRQGLVKQNVAELADGPSIDRKERRSLTSKQARSLLNAVVAHRDEAAILLGLGLGLRKGEILGLSWSDIDIDGDLPVVHVRKQIQRLPVQRRVDGGPATELVRTDLKTRKSRRALVLPDQVARALRKRRARQAEDRLLAGEEWVAGDDLVFTTSRGRPRDPRAFSRVVGRVAENAGLGKWSPHELRHSNISLSLLEGVPLHTMSDVAGHSSVRVTKDVYGHILDEQRKEAADAMDRIFSAVDDEDDGLAGSLAGS